MHLGRVWLGFCLCDITQRKETAGECRCIPGMVNGDSTVVTRERLPILEDFRTKSKESSSPQTAISKNSCPSSENSVGLGRHVSMREAIRLSQISYIYSLLEALMKLANVEVV